jgi:hypothetical protein
MPCQHGHQTPSLRKQPGELRAFVSCVDQTSLANSNELKKMDEFKSLLRMSLPQDKIDFGKLRDSRTKLMELSNKIKRLSKASHQLSLVTKTDYVNRALESRHSH